MDESIDYRPVSRLAVAAAGAGLASAVAVVSPVFLAVPLVGIAVSIAALRELGPAGTGKAGRLAALAGLALAVGFGMQGLTQFGLARWLGGRRAEAASRVWLEAVCTARSDDARGMCGPAAEPAVARLAGCCGGPPATTSGVAGGEVAGTWVVQATVGACTARIVLAAETATAGGQAVERWLIVACDVSPAAR